LRLGYERFVERVADAGRAGAPSRECAGDRIRLAPSGRAGL